MELIEAIRQRHSVRRYTGRPIDKATADTLRSAIESANAVNQQKFKFILHDGNKVETKTFFSPWGYTIIDLGIVKYHFEIGAGKDKFTWL